MRLEYIACLLYNFLRIPIKIFFRFLILGRVIFN